MVRVLNKFQGLLRPSRPCFGEGKTVKKIEKRHQDPMYGYNSQPNYSDYGKRSSLWGGKKTWWQFRLTGRSNSGAYDTMVN